MATLLRRGGDAEEPPEPSYGSALRGAYCFMAATDNEGHFRTSQTGEA
jgi:hypothetical protein